MIKSTLCRILNPLLSFFNLTLIETVADTLWDEGLIEYYRYQKSLQTDSPLDYPQSEYPPKDFLPTQTEWEEVSYLLKKGMTVCELGAGTGRFTDLYFHICEKVYLVDLSLNICEHILKDKYQQFANINVLHCPDCRMPAIKSASVDVFFGFGVFSHMNTEQLVGYLNEALRILKPSGKLVIEYQSLSEETGWQRFLSRVPQDFSDSIFRYHHTESLEKLAKRLGFQVNRSVIDKNNLNGSYLHLEKLETQNYQCILESAVKPRNSEELQSLYSATGIAQRLETKNESR